MTTAESLHEQIRTVLAQYGKLPGEVASIGVEDDLFRAGLTSHSAVNVMLGLEDAFDVEFPDAMLQRTTFESIAAMTGALSSLLTASAAS